MPPSTSSHSHRRPTNIRLSTVPSQIKPRQLSHLNAQLAQLQAHLSDLENHLRVTKIQADSFRTLGGLQGGLFMATSEVLGKENNHGQE